jgi:hypothetical protein
LLLPSPGRQNSQCGQLDLAVLWKPNTHSGASKPCKSTHSVIH